jgi:hypothetical protein
VNRIRLKRCAVCAALVPPWRRACWPHLVALREIGFFAAAVAAVVLLSAVG